MANGSVWFIVVVFSDPSPLSSQPPPARVYGSALKKHSEVFHLCAELDPVQCIKRLQSKKHLSRTAVKDVEWSFVKGRSSASKQLLSHILQLPDAGLCYFVDKYLRAQHLDSLAETLVNCPGDGVCELDSAEHHRMVTTSTASECVPAPNVGEVRNSY